VEAAAFLPRRFAAGTGHFWNESSAVSDARMPILSSRRLTVKPGVSRSTRNIEIPAWRLSAVPGRVRAATK